MKTKTHMTISPKERATFSAQLQGILQIASVFCRNREIYCHSSRAGERSGRFKKWKFQRCGSSRRIILRWRVSG
jgi:hypothetical protein